jgi:hypothetical protein
VHEPYSAHDPYHRPDAPRPSWQQDPGYPTAPDGAHLGDQYARDQYRNDPTVNDPAYYNAPSYGYGDDEPQRRFSRTWFVLIAVAVVVLVVGLAVLNSGSDSKNSHRSAKKAAMTEQWRSTAPVSSWENIVVGDVAVGIECNQRAGPHIDGAGCVLRGRGLADGQQRWEIADQPLGMTVAAAGSTVVLSGDGAQGGIRNNNAGNQQAHRSTTLVDGASGRIIASFANQIAWRYSQRTVVLHDLDSPTGRQNVTAVAAATGQTRWQFAGANLPDDGRNEFSGLLPQGFAPTPVIAGDVVVLDGPSQVAVRELDTGNDIMSLLRKPDDTARYLAYIDNVLVRVVPGAKARLEGLSTTNVGAPAWRVNIPIGAVPMQCSTVICLPTSPATGTSVINPGNGRTIAKNPSGAMYALRAGDAVAVVKCPANGSIGNPCPIEGAALVVYSVKNGKQLWHGGSPVFATAQTTGDSSRLIVGTAKPGATVTNVVAVAAGKDTVSLGNIDNGGLVQPVQVQADPVADAYQPAYLPTTVCGVAKQILVCGTRWQLNQIVARKLSD